MAITFITAGYNRLTLPTEDARYVDNWLLAWTRFEDGTLGHNHTDLARAIGNGLAFGPGDMAR